MSSEARTISTPVLAALGVGICLGAGGTVIFRYFVDRNSGDQQQQIQIISTELSWLREAIDQLRNEIASLRREQPEVVQALVPSASRRGYYSVYPSSGDEEEEIFVEAPAYESEGEFIEVRRPVSPAFEEDELFRKLDEQLEESDETREQAYQLCETTYAKLKQNPEFLWRYAYATYLKSQMFTGSNYKDKKKEMAFLAKQRAQEALEITEDNANVHKWFAISVGGTTDFLSTSEKIKVGYVFKNHVEKAIKINPLDPTLFYLLGRWCLEVYSLTWFERKVAQAIFSVPPTATIDETLQLFLKSDSLRDEDNKLKENYLYIAKCYVEMKDNSNAVSYLEKANALPTKSQDDKEAQTEVETLLKKYR